jgi:hypothetical protein
MSSLLMVIGMYNPGIVVFGIYLTLLQVSLATAAV